MKSVCERCIDDLLRQRDTASHERMRRRLMNLGNYVTITIPGLLRPRGAEPFERLLAGTTL
jgi:hypothetical protein